MKRALIIDPGIAFLQESGAEPYFPRGAMSITSFLRTQEVPADFFFLDTLRKGKSFKENVSIIYGALQETIKGKDYVLIAIGGPFTIQYPLFRMIAEMCRELSPRSHITLGGVHVTYTDEESLNDTLAADSIIRGEAEWTALELFMNLRDGLPFENVKSISFRKEGAIHRTPVREPGNLEELPVLDYGLIPADCYKKDIISLTTSRGCVFNCNFCVEQRFWGNRMRLIPLEKLIAEIQIIRKITQAPVFAIDDSVFTLNTQYFFSFCDKMKEIKEKDFLICHVMSRVDSVSDEIFKALREAGIFRVCFGVENLSEKVLKTMNKRITRDKIINALTMARAHGIFVVTLWIFGHPGDDLEQSEITINGIEELYEKDLHQTASLSMFIPYPGTAVYEDPGRFGLKIHRTDWDNWGRHNIHRICELENYPSEELIKEYARALEIKVKHENFSVLRYFSKDAQFQENKWRLTITPTDLGTHVINDNDIESYWKEFASVYPDGITGIFFSTDRIIIKCEPHNTEKDRILQQMTSRIIDSIGGEVEETGHHLVIRNTNTQNMKQFALFEHLLKIAQSILEA